MLVVPALRHDRHPHVLLVGALPRDLHEEHRVAVVAEGDSGELDVDDLDVAVPLLVALGEARALGAHDARERNVRAREAEPHVQLVSGLLHALLFRRQPAGGHEGERDEGEGGSSAHGQLPYTEANAEAQFAARSVRARGCARATSTP